MTLDQHPDAIRSPLVFAGSGNIHQRIETLQREFGSILGVARVFVRNQGAEHFLSGAATDSIQFSGRGPRSGEARYEWSDRGDGVFYGYLRGNRVAE